MLFLAGFCCLYTNEVVFDNNKPDQKLEHLKGHAPHAPTHRLPGYADAQAFLGRELWGFSMATASLSARPRVCIGPARGQRRDADRPADSADEVIYRELAEFVTSRTTWSGAAYSA